ncbi:MULTISPECIES: hypothetical protein [unclassified Paenibacillus]|uniref:hypothetical protein n=1 Tax=unclassified Paenibacillus TaxID=185978 RepID=UPI0009A7CB45|nr:MULTISPECIES: hypothetical protein [unclassified Paenibacillus]SLJ96938.1 hypothetical protein SAMN06272722_102479 [Paenibacillus sp. RU5A]SOC67036.1 hypothetical protein SAMN05880581_102519 [Paenibacillus sp. RU26A]SOC69816.1 hypothetical protein SAMN05880586_102479 [Paenibacillus sp. RU5M]
MEDLYLLIHDPSKDIYTKIDEIVDDFWIWSKKQKQVLEWETNYSNWSLLISLVFSLIETTEYTEWDQNTLNNLLYLIARDNECETIIDKLSERSSSFLFLAEEALRYSDNDARWQFAHYLIQVKDQETKVIELIKKYSEDYVEYVRRRALAALEIINCK